MEHNQRFVKHVRTSAHIVVVPHAGYLRCVPSYGVRKAARVRLFDDLDHHTWLARFDRVTVVSVPRARPGLLLIL